MSECKHTQPDDGLVDCEGCGGRFLDGEMSCDWPELCLGCAETMEDGL